jgi:hypothetical protein
MLALVMAIAVPAIASSTQGKLTPAKVKTIVKDLAPGLSVKRAKTADSAKNIISANVAADGTLVGSIPPGATVGGGGQDLGLYSVEFPRSIASCAISASLESNSGILPSGEIDVGPIDTNTVGLATFSSSGAAADRGFYVQASCPR